MLGALVALELGVGLIEVRKDPDRQQLADSDAWLSQTTRPDYRDRHLSLGFRRGLLQSGDRVVFVDDWIETGSQALAIQGLVEAAGGDMVRRGGDSRRPDGQSDPSAVATPLGGQQGGHELHGGPAAGERRGVGDRIGHGRAPVLDDL
jgi:hypothetical protein